MRSDERDKVTEMPLIKRFTSKSGWTPYVYYTTLYSTPGYYYIRRIYWGRELLEKWGNQRKRQLCKENSRIQGLVPKYND